MIKIIQNDETIREYHSDVMYQVLTKISQKNIESIIIKEPTCTNRFNTIDDFELYLDQSECYGGIIISQCEVLIYVKKSFGIWKQ